MRDLLSDAAKCCHISWKMRLLIACRFFIGLSLLSSCVILYCVFTSSLSSTGDLATQSIRVDSSGLSDLRSTGLLSIIGADTDSKEPLLDSSQHESLERIQVKWNNKGQVKIHDAIRRSYPMMLLSSNRSVRSDAQGNLGSPSVITSESVSNWLTDRWQG